MSLVASCEEEKEKKKKKELGKTLTLTLIEQREGRKEYLEDVERIGEGEELRGVGGDCE